MVQSFRLRYDPKHDICKELNKALHKIREWIDDLQEINGYICQRE